MSVKSTLLRSVLFAERIFRSAPSTPPQNVLILEYRLPLGCCVHLTPLYEALKVSRPELTLIVATRGLGAQLLRYHPHIDHLIETPDALTSTLAAARHLRAELRRRNLHPHLTLTGASDQRSRIALLALLASPARRAGYTLVPGLYQNPFAYDVTRSLIDNNLRLAVEAACSPEHREPAVFFSACDLAHAHSLAAEANPDGRPLLVMVTQPSGGQSTGWHAERFAEVARYATRTLGCAVTYVGVTADREPIERLLTASGGGGVNLAGRTTVTQLAALLAVSDYLVSLDTGTMHLGRAVGLPLVALGPSWQKPLEWLPMTVPSARILRGPDRNTVPPGYKLGEIEAAQVIGSLEELIAAYPASQEARALRVARSVSMVDHLGEAP